MKSLFTWALACFSLSVMLAIISLVLGAGLNYNSYLVLFNGLATFILLALTASISISILGIIRERYRRFRYLILMFAIGIFFLMILLD